jgi:DNA-directed RNA polymerase sigma subunit (sigma70/sigma32)
MSFFVLVFDRQTRELRASERYEDMESAALRMTELDTGPSTCVITVEADDEQSLRVQYGEKLTEIAERAHYVKESVEASEEAMRETVATFPQPERRIISFFLWGRDDTRLTREEIASEVGCSVRTVKKLEKRAFAKLMDRL